MAPRWGRGVVSCVQNANLNIWFRAWCQHRDTEIPASNASHASRQVPKVRMVGAFVCQNPNTPRRGTYLSSRRCSRAYVRPCRNSIERRTCIPKYHTRGLTACVSYVVKSDPSHCSNLRFSEIKKTIRLELWNATDFGTRASCPIRPHKHSRHSRNIALSAEAWKKKTERPLA